MNLLKVFVLVAQLIWMSQAKATTTLIPELLAGYTTNVYQDDFNKKSDFFIGAKAKLIQRENQSTITGQLGLTLYGQESANNYLNYLLKYFLDSSSSSYDLTLAMGGISYLKNQSGATDTSYNHNYVNGYLTTPLMMRGKYKLLLEPGAKLTFYSSLNNRRDAYLFVRLLADIELNAKTFLYPYVEIGFNRSNDSYYNRNDFNLGVTYFNDLKQDLTFFASLNINNSTYLNRIVSQILTTSRGQGRVTTTSVDTLETAQYSALALGLEITSNEWTMFGDISLLRYATTSNLEFFSETQVVVGVRTVY